MKERLFALINYSVQVQTIERNDKSWGYCIHMSNTYTSHTNYYYSTNLRTLQKHREKMISYYQNLEHQLNSGSSYQGCQLKPTLLDRILAKKSEKIRGR